MYFFLDLPESSKALQVDDIINLDTAELQTEKTGEKIIHELQDWLLKVDPTKVAILPDDKIQRILVGVGFSFLILLNFAEFYTIINYSIKTILSNYNLSFSLMFQACNQLEIATHIEMVASMLRRDAVKLIKAALAGTKTE